MIAYYYIFYLKTRTNDSCGKLLMGKMKTDTRGET